MIEELKPCPFCGGEPYHTKSVNGSNMNYVGCSSCGFQFKAMRTDYDSDSLTTRDIVAAWNKRPPTTEEIEAELYKASAKLMESGVK